jgi:DNA ligase-1
MEITLYKSDKKGKILQWTIEVEDNKFRTIEGFVDGKLTESKWTICKGKNIGKSNETSDSQQAVIEAKAKAVKKQDKGYYENIEDANLGTSFLEPMLAHSYSDYSNKIDIKNTYSQPKLDGIRCVGTLNNLNTRNGKSINSAPHIINSVNLILENNPNIVALDGELYNHELKNDFNKIVSLVKKAKPTKEDLIESGQLLQYHIYDLVMEGTFTERLEILQSLINYPYIKIVTTNKINTVEELDKDYQLFLNSGYEGQMIRISNSLYEHKRSKNLLKRKEFIDEECEIVDIVEGIGNRSGGAGYVVCKYNDKTFEAGIKGNYEYYTELLLNKDQYIGKNATIRYQNLTPKGVPRFGVMVTIRDYE